MAEQEPEEKTPSPASSEGSSSSGQEGRHRMKITPEQRRFLGRARSRQDWVGAEGKKEIPARPATEAREEPPPAPGHDLPAEPEKEYPPSQGYGVAGPPSLASGVAGELEGEQEGGRRERRVGKRPSKLSRALQMQNVVLFFGALLFLLITFYVGRKFDYWKYVLLSKNKTELSTAATNKFPNASADELIGQALVSERVGDWRDAAERLIAAKYKNLFYRGILFRVGKLYYDHSDFDSADKLFERAIAFGEDVDTANYYRGMIAKGRADLPAAERFFEAAANAAPFNADYFYSWAEALRRDHRQKEAIARYEQAALRAAEAEANICRYKIRLTTLEAGDIALVANELETKKNAGPLPVDWLMTEAALQIHAGHIDEAVRLVRAARASDRSLLQGHFAACVGDKLFSEASNAHPQLAEACRMFGARPATP